MIEIIIYDFEIFNIEKILLINYLLIHKNIIFQFKKFL